MQKKLNRNDVPKFEKLGFDGQKYIKLQTQKIIDRAKKFPGKLYLEIGGKFLRDGHAARVLPGFDPESKIKVVKNLLENGEIWYCVSYKDIIQNRAMSNDNTNFLDYVFMKLQKFEEKLNKKPKIILNFLPKESDQKQKIQAVKKLFQKKDYKVYERFWIDGYPDVEKVLGPNGYSADEYIFSDKKFVIVTGAGSNSGKMSTCLGQVYLDKMKGISSGYAKYETFPIWNLDLNHPVNLAYEAATADIGDYNVIDPYHKKAYGIDAVNYNRDVENFVIIIALISKIIDSSNFMKNYKSPTDMGINMAGFCIIDEKIVWKAGVEEIKRRKERYQQLVDLGRGKIERVEKCENLLQKLGKI